MDVVKYDRLSSLPDDLIHKILAFVDTKQVVEMSYLSSRWRYIWTSIPYLNLSTEEFSTLPKFAEFVTHFLSSRNYQIEVHSVELTYHRDEVSLVSTVKTILDYAFSHNVQQLNIDISRSYESLDNMMEYPLSFFSSKSLKCLTFTRSSYIGIVSPPTWKLPALETLILNGVTFNDVNSGDVFSNCANLKNLTLRHCTMMGENGFSICHPRLSNLTLIEHGDPHGVVNVITPQLKSLVIERWRGGLIISAPNVSSFHYSDRSRPWDDELSVEFSFELSADFLHLEVVDICIPNPVNHNGEAYRIVCLLQQLHSVKFLTLNLEIITLLSEHVELISHLPSPFFKLNSLKIYPDYVGHEEQTEPEVPMSTEVKKFLLDGSPGAIFTMVTREDVRAVRNVAFAQELMIELQDMLKENSKTNMTELENHMTTEHDQVEVENHRAQTNTKMKWHFGERITHFKSYWEDLNVQLEKVYVFSGRIISLLHLIEDILSRLPTSHRDKLQAGFTSLYAEAETAMSSMMDRTKIQCDKKPSHSIVSFHELATTSQPSS